MAERATLADVGIAATQVDSRAWLAGIVLRQVAPGELVVSARVGFRSRQGAIEFLDAMLTAVGLGRVYSCASARAREIEIEVWR